MEEPSTQLHSPQELKHHSFIAWTWVPFPRPLALPSHSAYCSQLSGVPSTTGTPSILEYIGKISNAVCELTQKGAPEILECIGKLN